MNYEEEVSKFLQDELFAVSINMAILESILYSDEYKDDLQKRIEVITQYTVANMVFSFLCGKYGREKAVAYLNEELKTDDVDIDKLFNSADVDWLNGIIQ